MRLIVRTIHLSVFGLCFLQCMIAGSLAGHYGAGDRTALRGGGINEVSNAETVDIEPPELLILSSGQVARSGMTDAIRDGLADRGFTVTPWTEGFFPDNEIALNTFLKQLLCYDAAVVVLGDDDIRRDPAQPDREQHVPRDNVIFELGSCMSRLGPKKTFIVCPDSPEVILPNNFRGVKPFTYNTRQVRDNRYAAVGSACAAIATRFSNFDQSAFFSDLPAGGLAHGYYYNFLLPTYTTFARGEPKLRDSSRGENSAVERTVVEGDGWTLDRDFKLSVVIAEQPLDRDEVQDLFIGPRSKRKMRFAKLQLALVDGRDIIVYCEQRREREAPFHIFDVPTTLRMSQEVVKEVDAFWGKGDISFQARLTRREGLSFRRALRRLIPARPSRKIEVISKSKFDSAAFESKPASRRRA